MSEQPVARAKKHTAANGAAVAFIGAALLTAFVMVPERFPAQPRRNRVQITMVCVSGFSWDRVIPLQRGGRLPFLARLFRGTGSYGDSISYTFDTDPAIIASLFTGRFPAKHAIFREEDFLKLAARDSFQTPIWQELMARGQQCMVVGLPFTPDRQCSGSSAWYRERRITAAPAMAREYQQRITRGVQVPADLTAVLQECISSDLERMQQAVTARAACSGLHLFAYFQGLGRWQSRLLAQGDALPDRVRSELIDNYYIFFDRILALLFSQRTDNGVFVVLSERGNSAGRPACVNQIPHLRSRPAIGFFYATGLHIRAGIEPLTIAPADVVPTLLCLAGISTAQRLDGRVMFNLLDEHYYFQRKIISDTP